MDETLPAPVRGQRADRVPQLQQGRLFRKYFLLILALVCGVMLVSGGINRYFTYQHNKLALAALQQEKVSAAAARIGQFFLLLERQLAFKELSQLGAGGVALRELEFRRMLDQFPAVTRLTQLDDKGQELLAVTRNGRGVAKSATDHAQAPAFVGAKPGTAWYGPIILGTEAEPHMEIALRAGGVGVAEVNLGFVRDVVRDIKPGSKGRAYVVDRAGHLVTRPEGGQGLATNGISRLAQVQSAIARAASFAEPATIVRDPSGAEVLTAFADVQPIGWKVFVEQPAEDINPAINATLLSAAALMLAGLLIATLTSLWLARSLVRPIRALQEGAQRIGEGELDLEITVRTGDELESLADQFNVMAVRLRESYADLERKVEARTREIQDKSRQLEMADKHKSEFLASMSHELRTPLNAIIGFSDVLLEKMFGELNPKQFEYLKDIHSSGQHLLSLINDILDLAKVEAGRMELVPGAFDLHAAIENALTLIRERAMQHGITLSCSVDPQLGAIVADERKFKQILLNLLSNAVKFTPPGGSIRVDARGIDDMVEIAVTDTGVGIAREDQDTVFDEFKQIGTNYARKAEGTGLGLALTRKFVELHGGAIRLESEPGKGSTFAFSIPASAAAGGPPPSL